MGCVEKVESALETERKPLIKGGLNVDLLKEALTSLHEQARQTNEQQEQLKRMLKTTTNAHVVLLRRLYTMASSILDMMIGAVQKGSVAAKNLQRIRSRIKRPNGVEAPTVEPLPQATD